MGTYKRPLQRSLIVSCVVFLALMSVVMSTQIYVTFSRWYFAQYNENLTHVINGLQHIIDVDDLQECIQTRVESPKFKELQKDLNLYVDDYGLAYLYIIIPRTDGVMVSVCSATSAEERAAGEEDWPLLFEDDYSYTAESIKPYVDAWDSQGITFFETNSTWGRCYSACAPLVASDGQQIALLCADLYTESMHQEIEQYVVISALLCSGIGIAFVVLLLLWLRRNVTQPISKLEKSARNYAIRSHERRDPSMLLFDDPHIHTQNEVESLSDAIMKMSENMQDYLENILMVEQRILLVQKEAEGMTRLAYEDALTHVRNKAAYALKVGLVKEEIAAGTAEFAILMVDLNNLKYVNDTFGHENGDRYLTGACQVIGLVLDTTPLYRTGGDEFVAILEGEDYKKRATILHELETCFSITQADEVVEPWDRYSAACGMAKYRHNESYEDTFSRADHAMYRNKKKMKMHMKEYVKAR